ncbi:CsbD family protein [Pararhodospirillum photometricum]|nr:CsbD family protein [Pararhodospirillum photometricum]
MDKDRIAGAAKQAKGAVKEATGKVLGDAKMSQEGKLEKVEGKVQNAIGGARDKLKE